MFKGNKKGPCFGFGFVFKQSGMARSRGTQGGSGGCRMASHRSGDGWDTAKGRRCGQRPLPRCERPWDELGPPKPPPRDHAHMALQPHLQCLTSGPGLVGVGLTRGEAAQIHPLRN